MRYERFEDLPVWKAAMELAERVYRLTRSGFFAQPGDLCSQIRRAALSISNNIAEGFERGSTSELIAFLYIARGSAGEVRSMLCFIERLDESAIHKSEISNFKSEISALKSLAESCGRQIRAWTDSLQNSSIKGQRHLNDRSRQAYEHRRQSDAFWRRIEADAQARMQKWVGPNENNSRP